MLKRVLAGFAGLIILLIAVLVGRTLAVPVLNVEAAGQAASIDAERAAAHLAEAVRFETISHQRGADAAAVARSDAAFTGFRNWMDATYPAFTEATSREIVGGHTLFYTWAGSDATLDPVLLMSHIDVVPIAPGTEDQWEHPPFSGAIADGYVWGRGTIDNKGSLIAMVEAAELLAARGFRPVRSIMFAFGHDEEIGGGTGNKVLAELLQARGTRLHWVKDEGGVIGHGMLPGVNTPVAMIGVAEKGSISLDIVAYSRGGHSSMPSPAAETAIGRLARALERIGDAPFTSRVDGATRGMIEELAQAAPFLQRLVYANLWLFEPVVRGVMEKSPTSAAQIHTTIAPTIIEGGNKENVLPPEARGRQFPHSSARQCRDGNGACARGHRRPGGQDRTAAGHPRGLAGVEHRRRRLQVFDPRHRREFSGHDHCALSGRRRHRQPPLSSDHRQCVPLHPHPHGPGRHGPLPRHQ
ncbi:MAG: M20/M25/M40 family metallo-hydrolase [Parvibaculum sp.]|nr:M20/M25/M40 family metallo-hydrolase [Parvibaculum sp.]MCW5726071.1 M20/M25/M40 family metallo-hydrolase [Parvibaculum sp.]